MVYVFDMLPLQEVEPELWHAILHNQSAHSAADSLRIIDKAFILTEVLIHLIDRITQSITLINHSDHCSQTKILSSESL